MKRKSAFPFILALAMFFSSCVSPSEGASKPSIKVSAEDVEVWSAPGTEKVLQDQLTGYDDIKGEAEIEVFTARGEYEGQHLILTSEEKPITGINVSVSDLTLIDDSTVKFEEKNIEVFFEKYVEVKKNYENNGAPTGKDPDALVPMKNIVEYGENTMEAGTNQGLYETATLKIMPEQM